MVAEERIRYYLSLPYRISVACLDGDDPRRWRASVDELVGCEARGPTPAEAVAGIPNAVAEWVEAAHAEGREIPEPRDARQYSGKVLVRMPQSLHAELAHEAERDQISLNAYINGVLAAALGWRQPGVGGAAPPEAHVEPYADAERRQRLIMIAVTVNIVLVAVATVIGLALLLSG
jgi:predicted HicB family RNase H-like nuclease